MDRWACVELPAFALQLLIRRNPDWASWPAALVARESPQGEILQVNKKARKSGIFPGLRFAAALSLCPLLRAGQVVSPEKEDGIRAVTQRLLCFSPRVEPSLDEPGSFWLDASGLSRLHCSPRSWAEQICADLLQDRLFARVTVGFTRFGTQAVARSGRDGVIVLSSPEDEAVAALAAPLQRLTALQPLTRDALLKLGVSTLGQLLQLPAAGLLERFGPRVHQLHRRAAGELWSPLIPLQEEEPILEQIDLDEPEGNRMRLTFLAKRLLGSLLAEAARRHRAVVGVEIGLGLERAGEIVEQVRPAAPTLDETQLIDLLRLRLEAIPLSAKVTELTLEAHTVPAEVEQLSLFLERPRRDLAAAQRAFARLRAEFGPAAVVRARLIEAHLPEASFVFEPLEGAVLPRPIPASQGTGPGARTLVRRIHARPVALQSKPVCGPRGAHLAGMDQEPASEINGPHTVSGGWWVREVHRDYLFARTEQGRILWVYYDRCRGLWFAQGEVE